MVGLLLGSPHLVNWTPGAMLIPSPHSLLNTTPEPRWRGYKDLLGTIEWACRILGGWVYLHLDLPDIVSVERV